MLQSSHGARRDLGRALAALVAPPRSPSPSTPAATIRDVQDFAEHRDLRTTRRYDHTRDALDRSAAYTIASWLD